LLIKIEGKETKCIFFIQNHKIQNIKKKFVNKYLKSSKNVFTES